MCMLQFKMVTHVTHDIMLKQNMTFILSLQLLYVSCEKSQVIASGFKILRGSGYCSLTTTPFDLQTMIWHVPNNYTPNIPPHYHSSPMSKKPGNIFLLKVPFVFILI